MKAFLTNLLPRSITLSTVKVKVTSIQGQEIWFKATNVELQRGKNEIHTTCNITAPGVYIFEKVELEWHSLVFQQEFVQTGKKQYLNLYPHGNALRVDVRMARESERMHFIWLTIVYLDQPKNLVVTVGTGWNNIERGEVMVKSRNENVRFDLKHLSFQVSPYDNGTSLFGSLISRCWEANAIQFEQTRYCAV